MLMYYETVENVRYRLYMKKNLRRRMYAFADEPNVLEDIRDFIDYLRARGYRFDSCEKITTITRTEHIDF